jgi:hypothetical protein
VVPAVEEGFSAATDGPVVAGPKLMVPPIASPRRARAAAAVVDEAWKTGVPGDSTNGLRS